MDFLWQHSSYLLCECRAGLVFVQTCYSVLSMVVALSLHTLCQLITSNLLDN